jgi:hypothetical protein
MTDLTAAIEAAIANLRSRQPPPKGPREVLAPYVSQLRELLSIGWTQSEILVEIKAHGGKFSPALFRDVTQNPTATKARKASQPKHRRLAPVDASTPDTSAPALPAEIRVDQHQHAPQAPPHHTDYLPDDTAA